MDFFLQNFVHKQRGIRILWLYLSLNCRKEGRDGPMIFDGVHCIFSNREYMFLFLFSFQRIVPNFIGTSVSVLFLWPLSFSIRETITQKEDKNTAIIFKRYFRLYSWGRLPLKIIFFEIWSSLIRWMQVHKSCIFHMMMVHLPFVRWAW